MERELKYRYLPTVNGEVENVSSVPVKGDAPCPCCGNITIPNHGDALAYICPVCFWEIDLFIQSDDEPSDQNHGMTLTEARANYRAFGAVQERLKPYCREPEKTEISK